jgi:hypothetical protein
MNRACAGMALAAFQWFFKGRDKSERYRKDSRRLSDELVGGAAFDAGAAVQSAQTLLVRWRKTI